MLSPIIPLFASLCDKWHLFAGTMLSINYIMCVEKSIEKVSVRFAYCSMLMFLSTKKGPAICHTTTPPCTVPHRLCNSFS